MPELSDKLKSLGVKLGAQHLKSPPASNTWSIEDIMPGRFVHAHGGSIYVVETTYPVDYLHGIVDLTLSSPLYMLAKWADDRRIAEIPAQSFAFIDTETSGLAGGTGTFAFLIGVGRFDVNAFSLSQLFMADPLEEPALLSYLEEVLTPYQAIVSFNGKSFDLPILNTRYLLQSWPPPLVELSHIDLLHLARRLWRSRLPNRSLSSLEVEILKTRRTEDEVPGWMIPQLYFDYLRSQDARPLKRVFYHNAMDILSMAALMQHMADLLENPVSHATPYIHDLVAVARIYEDIDLIDKAINLYELSMQYDLGGDSLNEVLQHLSFIYKRQGDIAQAMRVWELATQNQQIYANVELAKIYEHNLLDYKQALHYTQIALETLETNDHLIYERHVWMSELKHREGRLRRKMGIA